MIRSYFILVIFGIFLMAGCQPKDKKITIGYVQINEDPVLNVARAGIFKALSDSGYVGGVNIKVLDNNAQGDLSFYVINLGKLHHLSDLDECELKPSNYRK